jgi:hypothetical protein
MPCPNTTKVDLMARLKYGLLNKAKLISVIAHHVSLLKLLTKTTKGEILV